MQEKGVVRGRICLVDQQNNFFPLGELGDKSVQICKGLRRASGCALQPFFHVMQGALFFQQREEGCGKSGFIGKGGSPKGFEADLESEVFFFPSQSLRQQKYEGAFAVLPRSIDGKIFPSINKFHDSIQFSGNIDGEMSFRDAGAGVMKFFCHFTLCGIISRQSEIFGFYLSLKKFPHETG
ncbi:MAG: hypothetical protein WGN25_13180 [Candidatus Electrothrix sp. GW3-4]|uniref:hypothetical protein n=1 Tax=Candidatus Electrothrix sp. GW3-4 TaxID=3126740 RepID=UPI0030D170FD